MQSNIETRDKLIYGRYKPNRYKRGECRFSDLSLKNFKQLLAGGFIRSEANCGPDTTVRDVLGFMRKYPEYTAHGYTTEDEVHIYGVERGVPNSSIDEFQDYMAIFRDCSRFDTGTMFCSFEKGGEDNG